MLSKLISYIQQVIVWIHDHPRATLSEINEKKAYLMRICQPSPEDIRKLDEKGQPLAAMRDLEEKANGWKAKFEVNQRNKQKLGDIQRVRFHNLIVNLNALF